VIVPGDSQIRNPALLAAKLSLHGLILIDVIGLRESSFARGSAGV
jgi:hypothetical protein